MIPVFVSTSRIAYSDEEIHGHLCRYLDSARLCWCGNCCFQCSVEYTRMVDLRRMATAVTAVDIKGTTMVPVKGYLCSPQCLNRFKIDPHAYWKKWFPNAIKVLLIVDMPKQKSDRLMQYKCFSKLTCLRHAIKKCSLS